MINILENGLSAWPNYDGRFPLVSGLKFKFDGTGEVGSRILKGTLMMLDGNLVKMEQW